MQAKSKLYAPRLRGDMDLGLEPSRINPILARSWARMDTPGGLLLGGTRQEIYTITDVQNYYIGSRRMMDDRVFRYAHFGDDDPIINRGRPMIARDNGVETGAFTGILVAGAFTCTWTVQGAAVLANQYLNGYFFSDGVAYRILANTAGVMGDVITLTLDRPIYEDRAANVSIAMLIENPWANIVTRRLVPYTMNPGLVVGVQVNDGIGGQFGWVQTWGPCALMVNNITQGDVLGEAAWTDARAGVAAEEANAEVVTAGFSYQRIAYNLPRAVVNNIDNQYAAVSLIISP